MQILHLDLKPIQDNYVELRYFEGNPNDYQSRSLPLTEITDLIQIAERDYYTILPEDHQITGKRLFNWLDGNDRFFQELLNKQLNKKRGKGIVLAISTSGNISHLPWELLHDGKSFLVERKPGVIPVRWVSSDQVKQLSREEQPENRALQMLFMATSPLNVEPVLDFEREEANILEVTARQPLTLTVEESGCLQELGFLVEDNGKGYFDVLHLTGHATINDGEPAFITESPTGEAVYSTADDIATELQFQLPKLIFLSGCRTGQAANSGTVPSMAQSLLEQGAKSVLGWGQKVLETDATAAAAALYQALSAGKLLTEALALTYQALIENNARDWHLLRLYVGDTLPGNLVTPLRTRGRKPAPPRSFSSEFLDPAGKVKVPTRESFVGRRRQLQNCLRILMNPSAEEIGVLIHGMGGLGKSSLAARLCDRLTNFQRVVWVGRIDEASLVRRLTEKLDKYKNLREILQSPDDELKFRLKRVFGWLQETGDKPFLLVLDDFETNLEPRNDSYILKTEATKVLSALVWAINETYAPHRIIITCRYDFESNHLQDFYKQPLEGMRGADLRKKLSRLTAFNLDNNKKSQVDETLKAQAQRLADGNPRLLEWLDKVLLRSDVDVAEILNRLETDPVELREQVLAKQLLQQMDNTMQDMLQRGLVFELPVPREALEVVCEGIVDLDNYIDKAVALGLLEVSPDQSLRVPRILPLKLPVIATVGNNPQNVIATQESNLQVTVIETDTDVIATQGNSNPQNVIATQGSNPQPTAIKTDTTVIATQESNPQHSQISPEIFKTASQVLYRLWWESAETSTEEQKLEIHRLALLGKEKEIVANVASNLANNWWQKSRYRETVEFCKSTLEVTEDYRVLKEMAYCQQNLGEVEQALENYQQAKKLCPSEDEGGTVFIYHCLAILYKQQGKVDEAIALHQQSFDIQEKIGDQQGKAASLHCLGMIYQQQGKVDEAIALHQQSLDIKEKIGDQQGKAASLHEIARIYQQQGKLDDAIALHQQSFDIQEKIGHQQGKAASLHELAIIYQQQGKLDDALALFQEALQLFERIGDVHDQAMSLWWLGDIAQQQGDNSSALEYLQESFEILQRIKSPDAQSVKEMIDGIRGE